MDACQQNKVVHSWYGQPMNSDRKLRILQYKGILIKSERSRKERCIQLGDFVLVEGENADQPFVAQLLDLYEDGAQRKHAVVQWFSHITEIPKNKQKLLKRRISFQEVFFDQVSGYDTDIAVETIIDSALVVPLRLKDELPTRLKKEKIFCVKQSWDGKCFKALSPHTFTKLNEANKKGDGVPNTFNSSVPSDIVSSVKKDNKKASWSATKQKNVEMEIESKHSASKSSLSKKTHSLRTANEFKNPSARKKLELNSPTRSPKSKLLDKDVLELLDDDYDFESLKPTPIKRKVKFTEVPSSPPKIHCASDKLKSVFGTAEHEEIFSGTLRLSPYRKAEDSNEKVKKLNMEDDAIVLTGHKELGSQSPAVTPRSRRTCAQETSTRIAEQISLLNMLESKEEDDFLSSSDSYSSSSEEEDSDVSCTPEKKTKSNGMFSTPRSSRKPSVHTPAKTSRKTPLPGTPRTPRNATPEIPKRSHAAQKPTSVLEEARLRLHVSAVPESLPCREEEFQDIYNFVESKLIDGTGGCMYISGVPGTGKTATVHEVIRCLQRATEDDDLPSFQFIEINGMKLTDPHQAYVQILELLTGQKVTATHAAVLLAKLFCTPGPKRKTTVLVVDELDLLWTRKQNVMYNLFDWPNQKHSKLIILAIANTMDLPERIMMNRVSSRLGLTRMSFQPYTYKQLQEIVSSRLNSVKAFEEDAIQLVSRKVAALSGDARRCLDICRRAAEICEFSSQKNSPEIVRMTHVTQAIDEMFSSPYIEAIRNASLHEQIFFKAILAEFRRAGVEEATVQQVYHQHISLCRMEGMQSPTVSDIVAICARLGACRLLLLDSSNKYLHMRVRLNVSQDDVMYALKDD
ncbi:origin recognition complex subunit 1 [Coturnix japonica]|uniref:Origin recognition complex subunit 1 n=1 Tax=Coturnix japonica TaxID=93934 RepID=A0A8C2TIX1_COTJA|nr:origin recognition complex subunit 1 [Coturnix japonica]XP_015726054.1 origin recognition complex subunit 1 [Coturnix japonica]XP_015726055.1 origin recognition complex subunit 1 [Coturnix japonica]